MKRRLFYAVSIASAMMFIFSSCSKKTELFNGIDTSGWNGIIKSEKGVRMSDVFQVKEGNLHVVGKPFGYLRTMEKYSNCTLHVEWRWVGEGTNSGIFVHVQDGDKIWPKAIECQLCAGKAGDFVLLGGSRIAEIESKESFPVKERYGNFEKPVGKWNSADIEMKGNKIKVFINGKLQNECTSVHSEGYIALQSEGGPIEFRNIYVKK